MSPGLPRPFWQPVSLPCTCWKTSHWDVAAQRRWSCLTGTDRWNSCSRREVDNCKMHLGDLRTYRSLRHEDWRFFKVFWRFGDFLKQISKSSHDFDSSKSQDARSRKNSWYMKFAFLESRVQEWWTQESRVGTVAFLLGYGHRPNRETVPCPAVEQSRSLVGTPGGEESPGFSTSAWHSYFIRKGCMEFLKVRTSTLQVLQISGRKKRWTRKSRMLGMNRAPYKDNRRCVRGYVLSPKSLRGVLKYDWWW